MHFAKTIVTSYVYNMITPWVKQWTQINNNHKCIGFVTLILSFISVICSPASQGHNKLFISVRSQKKANPDPVDTQYLACSFVECEWKDLAMQKNVFFWDAMIGRISEIRAGHLCLQGSESKLCTTGPLIINSYSTRTLAYGHIHGFFPQERNKTARHCSCSIWESCGDMTVRGRITVTSSLNAILWRMRSTRS